MTQLFNGGNFVYRSVDVYRIFSSYLQVLVRFRNFYKGINYTGDLQCYVLDRIFDNLKDKSY